MLDPDLVGTWQNTVRTIRFDLSGDIYERRGMTAALSPDGAVLQLGAIEYDRVFGSDTEFFGVWSRQTRVNGNFHVVDLYWNPDNSFVNRETINGRLVVIGSGTFCCFDGSLVSDALYGRVRTQPLGTIKTDRGFLPQENGTYSNVGTDLTMDIDGIQSTYSKIIPLPLVIVQQKRNCSMAIDARLVGTWQLGASIYVIDPDGWYLAVDGPRGFTVSADGLTLTLDGENPVIPFDRVFGIGANIEGVWNRPLSNDGIDYVEELTFRADLSMSNYWTQAGSFMSNTAGRYTINAGMLRREERYSLVSTTSNTDIQFDDPFGPTETGTYTVTPDGNTWTLTVPNGTKVYSRLN